MKKLIFAAALALTTIAAGAKTADELRVYINPGHGSWTGNDRPMQAINHPAYNKVGTDTTNFYESNTNLRKGFGVLEKLREMGLKYDATLNQTGERYQIGAARDMSNNIVMSHVKCGPFLSDHMTAGQYEAAYTTLTNEIAATTDEAKKAELQKQADELYQLWKVESVRYNRNLSDICAEVEANNFDMFISIHSNAASGTTNFPIYLYRGYDNLTNEAGVTAQHQTISKEMAAKSWPYHFGNSHECWSSYSLTNANLRGDINFYGSSSTSSLGYKGYLGVLKHGVPGFLVEGYFHTYNVAMQRHMNMDVNYVEGYNYAHGIADYFGLAKEKTGTIYGIVRDEHEKFTADGYSAKVGSDDAFKPLNGAKVTLKKGDQVVAEYTTDDNFNGAYVFKNVEPGEYTTEISHPDYKVLEPQAVTVKAAEVTYAKAFMENNDYIPPRVVYVDYPDPFEGTSFFAPTDIAFKQAVVDKEIAELAGKTLKRFIAHGDYLYALVHAEDGTPAVYVIDANTLEVVATPSIEGCEGTESPLYDIAVTADGVLVGCNLELCHYGADQVQAGEVRGEQKIFRWNNDEETGLPTGDPETMITTNKAGNWLRCYAGLAMLYSGTIEEGNILISVRTVGSSENFHFTYISVIDGKMASVEHRNSNGVQDYFNLINLGVHTMVPSPLTKGSFITNSANVDPREYEITNELQGMGAFTAFPEGTLSKASANSSFFKYNGHSFMVASDVDADGKNIGIRMFDITNGLDKPVAVATSNTALEAAEGISAVAGRTLATLDNEDNVTAANIELFAVRGNKISRLTTVGEEQPQNSRVYAYGIKMTEGEDNYTVTFSLTGEAASANLVLTPIAGESTEVVTIPVADLTAGENNVVIAKEDLPVNTSFSLAVETISKTIAQPGAYRSSKAEVSAAKRGGVVVITDPEEENFGYTSYVIGGNNGIFTFTPAGEIAGPFFKDDSHFNSGNQSSPFRGDQRYGKAVFADWSDSGAGYWQIDPSNPVELTQLLAGTKASNGSYTYDGKIIGGGSSCVAFLGKGEDQQMFTFAEDLDPAIPSNIVARYVVGTEELITEPQVQVYDNLTSKLFANTNVDIIPTEHGMFVTQCRSEGNNAVGCPGFVFANYEDGSQLLNSGNLKFITSCNSGLAINSDLSLVAICQYTKITIASCEWEGDVPTLTYLYDFNLGGSYDFSQLKFDAAGNLHAYIRGFGYRAYSLPGEAASVVIPAKAEYVIKGNEVGVDNVAIDEAIEGEAVYYNLNGILVNGDQLTPGVYVKVQGGKATKVVIK